MNDACNRAHKTHKTSTEHSATSTSSSSSHTPASPSQRKSGRVALNPKFSAAQQSPQIKPRVCPTHNSHSTSTTLHRGTTCTNFAKHAQKYFDSGEFFMQEQTRKRQQKTAAAASTAVKPGVSGLATEFMVATASESPRQERTDTSHTTSDDDYLDDERQQYAPTVPMILLTRSKSATPEPNTAELLSHHQQQNKGRSPSPVLKDDASPGCDAAFAEHCPMSPLCKPLKTMIDSQ